MHDKELIVRRPFFLARFWLLVGFLIFAFTSAVIGLVISRKSHGDGCVIYDPGPNYYLSMFDVRTGQHTFSSVLSRQTNPSLRNDPSGPIRLDSKVYPPVGHFDSDYGPVILHRPSPSGRYIAILNAQSPYDENFSLRVDQSDGNLSVFTEADNTYEFAWSPDDKMIYINQSGDLVKSDPQTGKKRSGPLPYESNGAGFVLSPNGQFLIRWNEANIMTVIPTSELLGTDTANPTKWPIIRLSKDWAWIRWSPNSRYFAVLYIPADTGGGGGGAVRQSIMTPLDIFTVDGRTFRNVVTLNTRPTLNNEPFLDARWSADGNSMLYRQASPYSSQINLVAFEPQTGTRHIVEQQLLGPLAFSFENMNYYDFGTPDLERIAVVREDGDHLLVELMNTNGHVVSVPVPNASWVGDLLWSSDGKTLVIPWTAGQMPSRQAHITLVSSDGQKLWDVADNAQNITQLHWLRMPTIVDQPPIYDTLLYVAQQGSTYSVNLLDLLAGKSRKIADGFAQVNGLAWDQTAQTVSFWWQMAQNLYGTDQYLADGTRIYRFPAAGPVDEGGKVYPSPGGKFAILAVEHGGLESLQYASVGGSTARVLEPMRPESYEVAVSSNNSTLAVFDGTSVEELGMDGNRKWVSTYSENHLYWAGPGLSFGPCLPI